MNMNSRKMLKILPSVQKSLRNDPLMNSKHKTEENELTFAIGPLFFDFIFINLWQNLTFVDMIFYME